MNFTISRSQLLKGIACLAASVAIGFPARSAYAQDQVIEPVGRGTINIDSTHYSNLAPDVPHQISNYLTGAQSPSQRTRGFFVWNLPTAPAGMKVVAARIRLNSGAVGQSVRGGSSDIAFRQLANIAGLENQTATFAEITGGLPVGKRIYDGSDDDGGFREIPLNVDGVDGINAALGAKYAIGMQNQSSDFSPQATIYAFGGSGRIGTDVADGLSQLILTWGPAASVPPTITGTVPATMSPNQAPLAISFSATSPAGPATVEIAVVPLKVNGSGKVIDKSFSAAWNVSGGTLTITDSGGVGTVFFLFVKATGADGATDVNVYTIEVVRK